jgi:hypothetical protein
MWNDRNHGVVWDGDKGEEKNIRIGLLGFLLGISGLGICGYGTLDERE